MNNKTSKITDEKILENNFTWMKLGDVALIKQGKELTKDKMNNFFEFPVMGGGVKPTGYYNDHNSAPGIVIAKDGQAGHVSWISTTFWCTGHCYTVESTNNKVLNKYLFYILKLKQPRIISLRNGTTTPGINQDSLTDLLIPIPPLNIQEKIVSVLGAIDLQIETSNKLKKTIFKKMQLDYEYILKQDHDSRILKLKDVTKKIGYGVDAPGNFVLNKEGASIPYITIKNIKTHEINFDASLIDHDDLEIINKKANIEDHDILFTRVIPIGRTYMVNNYQNNFGFSQSVYTIKPDNQKLNFAALYLSLQQPYVKIQTARQAIGSVQKIITLGSLIEIKLHIPSEKGIKLFLDRNQNLFDLWLSIEHKVKKLNETKNYLLPLLLNQQVIVQ
ncbi:restriction endonuclease subunit S [Mycoplasmopsis agassizii]|uniref:Restriction endonuclease subunit S n=1 Tax=Mycoplasmopsis agassizii TaxID=33922 RepID=A0ABX4H5I3_9BACT|nr:restriction endonuclease subunit S [Mycoplasmopsis agassizii]PAF55158.1 restriction endonuclease subunit S [Mycoplasmopsis agassizii]SMC16804.1 Restriction endonuclease S subunit [Mycoplasmopsis agassizii]